MNKTFSLSTEHFILRPLQTSDAKEYSTLGVSYRSTGPINTEEKAIAYLEKSISSNDSVEVGIFLQEELIGNIEICHMSWFTRGCELCYTIKQEHHGKGYATEAVKGILPFLFTEMDMHKVYADTTPSNIASQRVLEKCGFKLEGTIRDRQFKDGRWVDELDYGLLKEEFLDNTS